MPSLLSSDSGARSVTTPPNPKANVVAFSMAGRPSDIFDQHRAGARFSCIATSGKRYVYTLSNGKVTVQPSVLVGSWNDASVKVPALSEAVSSNQARGGQSISPLPQFDMIAAKWGTGVLKRKRERIASFSRVWMKSSSTARPARVSFRSQTHI